ncbi:MAG: ABC transporter ATP-binding protein/permease [Clostridia bacterium]|nr:ABC transporter ATP-binding protein/permease [Clostridia bacterium]
MLELDKIYKEYHTEDETVIALKGISVKFRKSEFVSILGPSGCGKTTLLNIVGGLDRYSSGDLIINGKSTKDFSDKEWDTYRNHQIGFVFQSYNLIPHQTVLENVELALTLSGINAAERKRRAIAVLEKVGLKNKINSRPNQLSGGQMQRVAIARALINDPEILLADEPTGALDSKTSIQIMDLLKEISGERLIIMVTHNPELAEKYSTRIIRLLDGELIADENPVTESDAAAEREIADNAARTNKGKNKTSMSFFTALSLSFKNMLTKKGRTILVSFAGSIGIIGIALILSLSSGFQNYINKIQEDTLSTYPVTINKTTTDYSAVLNDMSGEQGDFEEFPDTTEVTTNDTFSHLLETMNSTTIENDLSAFKDYLENSDYDRSKVTAIEYTYNLNFDVYGYDEIYSEENVPLRSVMEIYMNTISSFGSASAMMGGFMNTAVWSEALDNEQLLKSQYEVLSGKWANFSSPDEVMLVVSKTNRIPDYVLPSLGLMDPNELLYPMVTALSKQSPVYASIFKDVKEVPEDKKAKREFDVASLVGKEFTTITSPYYYREDENGVFSYVSDKNDDFVRQAVQNGRKVKIVGVLRLKEGITSGALKTNLIYGKALTEALMDDMNNAPVVKAQLENKFVDVTTGKEFWESEGAASNYEANLLQFGYVTEKDVETISIYASTFEDKDYVVSLINAYNDDKQESEQIQYTDYMSILMSSITVIINAVSYVLIGFVSVSLVVSSIMIGIITYISVLERIKEIGILRALGASKKDVSRVFNAETLIIGFAAGVIGIGVTVLLNIPISLVIQSFSGIHNVAVLPVGGGVALVLISMALTLIAGLIPSSIASKKDPVIALRAE